MVYDLLLNIKHVCVYAHAFISVGAIGFALPSYTFIENEGMGIVTVNGPADFPSTLSVRIAGGL